MNWNHITIGKYRELSNITSKSDIERSIKVLSILKNKETEYFYDIPVKSLNKYLEELAFLGTKIEPQLKTEIKLGDRVFVLDPNISKWTTKRYIDYMTTINEVSNNHSAMMSILYVEKGRKYGDYDLDEAIELFDNHCPVTFLIGASDFFYQSLRSLTKTTLSSLKKKIASTTERETREKLIEIINQPVF